MVNSDSRSKCVTDDGLVFIMEFMILNTVSSGTIGNANVEMRQLYVVPNINNIYGTQTHVCYWIACLHLYWWIK